MKKEEKEGIREGLSLTRLLLQGLFHPKFIVPSQAGAQGTVTHHKLW